MALQKVDKLFGNLANRVARVSGRPLAFVTALAVVLVWAVSGPVFGYSDMWQLVINTGTTIITFLMVFLIQNSQNRDNAAIQVKLDELIRVGRVKNLFVGIEHLTDEEIDELRVKCETLARDEPESRNDGPPGRSAAMRPGRTEGTAAEPHDSPRRLSERSRATTGRPDVSQGRRQISTDCFFAPAPPRLLYRPSDVCWPAEISLSQHPVAMHAR